MTQYIHELPDWPFREQVEKSIEQANDPDTVWVSHEEVKAMSIKRRTAWARQAKGNVA